MKNAALISILLLLIALSAGSLSAATFVVPPDRMLVHQADAVVVASALASHPIRDDDGVIETVTTLSIEEVIEGQSIGVTLDVAEPGGVYDDKATVIPGVPQLRDGRRYVLFLIHTTGGWRILDLALGNFWFATDGLGRKLLVRDEGEIAGWDPDGSPHRERRRLASEFLDFVRTEARGGIGKGNYFTPDEPLSRPDVVADDQGSSSRDRRAPGRPRPSGPLDIRAPRAAVTAAFSATSYTFTLNGTLGGRWNVFPSAVNFFSVGTEPGAPGGGVTAINAAIASWNNDPSSNVNYVYAGADTSGLHNGGISTPDGENTISFERDLTSFGAPPFQCTSTSYSGTLGLGGITKASGTHTGPNGESFATTLEGDVEMNQGIANCALLINNGDFNSAVTHEVGHTLGFRHSDQTRADDPATPCSTDPTLDCATTAIMKSFVTQGLNAALQVWDQHAVAAVYPGASTAVPPAPTAVDAHAIAATRVLITWTAATGATSYEIYRRAAGGTFTKIGTATITSFTDTTVAANSAYLYRIRALNSGGSSADSVADLATTVIFTDDPLVPGSSIVKAVHLAELRTAVNDVRSLAGLAAATFTDAAAPGVVVKAVHVTELRTALDAAMSSLGLVTGGYTDAIGTGVAIKAVHFQELRNRVK